MAASCSRTLGWPHAPQCGAGAHAELQNQGSRSPPRASKSADLLCPPQWCRICVRRVVLTVLPRAPATRPAAPTLAPIARDGSGSGQGSECHFRGDCRTANKVCPNCKTHIADKYLAEFCETARRTLTLDRNTKTSAGPFVAGARRAGLQALRPRRRAAPSITSTLSARRRAARLDVLLRHAQKKIQPAQPARYRPLSSLWPVPTTLPTPSPGGRLPRSICTPLGSQLMPARRLSRRGS